MRVRLETCTNRRLLRGRGLLTSVAAFAATFSAFTSSLAFAQDTSTPGSGTTPATDGGLAAVAEGTPNADGTTTPPAPIVVPYGGSGTNGPRASDQHSLTASNVTITPIAYVETYYQYNFNKPSNGLSNALAFDDRHNTFTLSSAVAGADIAIDRVSARLTLQVGTTANSYYANEPTLAGASAASSTGPQIWKYVQEGYVGYNVPVGTGINVQAGLFLTPIGPETIAVKDNWTWSRSNLFFGLPFYMTGARGTYSLGGNWSVTAGVFNGWNTVVDDNSNKSVEAHLTYKTSSFVAQLLYFGGVERSTGAPEGPYWRHDVDTFAVADVTDWFSVLGEANVGAEPNRFGTSTWYAGQVAGRVKFSDVFSFALRGDRFYENLASNAEGTAAPLFWNGNKWVSSVTAAFETRPADHILFRLEYRHDQADGDLYFRGNVTGDGSTQTPFLPNSHYQNTITLGATAWL